MIKLWTSIYPTNEQLKKDEMMFCLTKNIENKYIDKIYILNETQLDFNIEKIVDLKINFRPTYNSFFERINSNISNPDEINIISNSDIYFDETISLIANMGINQCYALSRYEDGVLFKLVQSQDTWIFRGSIRPIVGDYCLGVMACDNRIAYEIKEAGYDISNPSLDIKTHHVHKSSREWIKHCIPLPGNQLHLEHVHLQGNNND